MKFAAVKPVSRVLARELAVTALLLLGVSVVVFAILYLAPGDPLNVLLEGQSPRSELALGMREALGVPRTWYGQYAAWFGRMLQGNFGNSIRTGLPVLPELARVGVYTLTLTLGSLVLTLLITLLIPVTEIMSAKIPFLLGGAVIVEQVFNWPGMGRMAWQAAQDRDFPVIMGIALVAAAFVRTGNLVQRVIFTAVNPRASRE